MHTDAPFLALLGQITGDSKYLEAAASHLLIQVHAFQGPSGLFSHGFDCETGQAQRIHWGRGNGWALLGITETLERLPSHHTAYAKVTHSLQRFVDAVIPLQREDGQFQTVLDDSNGPIENSISAFMTAGLLHAVRGGWLVPSTQDAALMAAQLSWHAAEQSTTSEGCLSDVSIATAASASREWYHTRPTSPCVPWGQGPLMLAAAEICAVAGTSK